VKQCEKKQNKIVHHSKKKAEIKVKKDEDKVLLSDLLGLGSKPQDKKTT
jgi:hypothetical protein